MAIKTTIRTWENVSVVEGRFNAVASLDNGVGAIEFYVSKEDTSPIGLDPQDVWHLADLFMSLKTELKKRNITPAAVEVTAHE